MNGTQFDLQNKKIFHLHIPDLVALKAVYMPYVRNGGIFIPTRQLTFLGDTVFLMIRLFDDPAKIPLCANVIWVTPANAQENKVQGIGLRFIDTGNGDAAKIEHALPEGKHSIMNSFTM